MYELVVNVAVVSDQRSNPYVQQSNSTLQTRSTYSYIPGSQQAREPNRQDSTANGRADFRLYSVTIYLNRYTTSPFVYGYLINYYLYSYYIPGTRHTYQQPVCSSLMAARATQTRIKIYTGILAYYYKQYTRREEQGDSSINNCVQSSVGFQHTLSPSSTL